MDVLNILAGLAAIVLSLELLLATILFAALCGGIWYGLRMAQKKSRPAYAKVHEFIAKGEELERKGLTRAVRPLIVVVAYGEQVGTTVSRLIERTQHSSPAER
jgi:hypothetical protein